MSVIPINSVVRAASITKPAVGAASLQRTITKLTEDLAHMDGELLSAANSYPGSTWGPSFRALAERIDDVRGGVRELGGSRAFDKALQRDVLDLAEHAGTTTLMSHQRLDFGASWSQALDAPITHMRAAGDWVAGLPR